MKYTTILSSPPVLYGEDYVFDTGYYGDSLVISVDYEYSKTLNTEDYKVKDLRPTPKPSVYLENVLTDTCHVGVAGDEIKFKVKLTKPHTSSISVSYTVTGEDQPSDVNIRKHPAQDGVEDDTDYSAFFKALTVSRLGALSTGVVTFLAGEIEKEVTIHNSPETSMFKGKGSFYVGKVTLSDVSDPSYMLHFDNAESFLLLEDSFTYPEWEGGAVEVWGKVNGLSYYQPILDPETAEVVTFIFGYDSLDDGEGNTTLTDPSMRSKQLEDTPLESIQFRSITTEVPVDVDSQTSLENNLPYVKYVVNVGRRG
ncbi:hypothetical protein VPBG_00014 [Vibrio phage helene 12B3]|uniref:hypothetical protein n=1 Tax=Vibrio phage helene 12B3 TaxID=573173 RepID=UPI0002C0A746|nr:hypothetical protein VPBG_00014 [Vibrio phage helene 12B3]AGG57787.1 hypothetical protein VPBG_00014 [Vibrio phage helene 12B3]